MLKFAKEEQDKPLATYGNMSKDFYHTKAWKRMRKAVLNRDGFQCQESKRYGKFVPADVVHHAFPVEDYPQYRLEAWNLISVSNKIHNQLHDRNTNELTDKGKELMERTARKQGIEL